MSMANQKHVDQLTQGVMEWNQWRDENPEVQPYMNGVYLYLANLRGVNLREAILYHASMDRANLSEADLRKADLSESNLTRANLNGADLSESNLSRANLNGANLSRANLTESILQCVTLDQVRLARARLHRTDLRGIPWLLVMELTLQPGIIWKDVRHDLSGGQDDKAEQ